MDQTVGTRKLQDLLAARFAPAHFLADQLRRPTGRFGRWVMTRSLNRGNAELIDSSVDALQLGAEDTFLDLGFGGGRSLAIAATRTSGPLWGIDYSGDVVLAGAARFAPLIRAGRMNLLCADVHALPLRDALCSAICSTNTIYFWSDPIRALANLQRVLRPGGRVSLGFSGATKMRQFDRIIQHGFTLYEPDQVETLLRSAGFQRIHTTALAGRTSRGDYVCLASK
jgi:arsenite methyltransferase